jgi:hypothetical protein
MVYELQYIEQRKLAIVLIFLPLAISAVFMWLLLSFKNLPDWIVIVSSFTMVATATASTLLVVKNWIIVKVTVEINDAYIKILMKKKSPVYPLQEATVAWNDVYDFTLKYLKGLYVRVKFRDPDMRFTLSPFSLAEEDINQFANFIQEVNKFPGKTNSANE